MEPADALIAGTLAAVPLDILQLVAPAARVAEIGQRFGREVWRVAGIRGRDDLPAAMDGADALLLDAKPPKDATRPGGNALTFDWSLLAGWAAPGPWLLAGGLTPGNVAAAIRQTHAPAVDVSSGVESAPGAKDVDLIAQFIDAAHGA